MNKLSRNPKFKIFLLISSLAICLPYQVAKANPTKGAICPKAGAIQVLPGQRFICVKSGKKLIWKILNSVPTQNVDSTLTYRSIYDQPCGTLGEHKTGKYWVFVCRKGSVQNLNASPHWGVERMVANTTNPIPISLPAKSSSGITWDNLVSRADDIYAAAFNNFQDILKKIQLRK